MELQALPCGQKKKQKQILPSFSLITQVTVADILNSAWEIENTQDKLARPKKLLEEAKRTEYAKSCNGQ